MTIRYTDASTYLYHVTSASFMTSLEEILKNLATTNTT